MRTVGLEVNKAVPVQPQQENEQVFNPDLEVSEKVQVEGDTGDMEVVPQPENETEAAEVAESDKAVEKPGRKRK